ncbi:Ig lambda chain V region 4A [Heterocephalus glaber]|nr:Ig lambda chain V region 4A [Heterocephalus glaber]
MKRPRGDQTLAEEPGGHSVLVRIPTMAWTMVLLGIFTFSSGVVSQTVVTQEPSMSVSSGETVSLNCGLSSGSVSTGNYPSWYQQNPGQAPHLFIYQTDKRPSGVPDRFSGSIAGNKAALTITGAQPEDEADYYCLLYMGSGNLHSELNPWGSATKTFSHAQNGLTLTLTVGRKEERVKSVNSMIAKMRLHDPLS